MVEFKNKIVQFGFGAVGKSFFEKASKEIKFDKEKYFVISTVTPSDVCPYCGVVYSEVLTASAEAGNIKTAVARAVSPPAIRRSKCLFVFIAHLSFSS